METDVSDYALAAIISIVNEENEVHLVAFYFCTFTMAELNYDTHDKELLAIFEAFKIWWHYLEGPAYSIDVVTNHKILSTFQLPRYWSGGKCSGLSTFLSSILSSSSVLVVLALNQMLLLDGGISILKRGILATLQSTLTTSN